MKCNNIFMYNTYTYNMCMFEIYFWEIGMLLARWHIKLKHWHTQWYVSMLIGMLAHENEKLVCFWRVGMQTRWHLNHASTQSRWHVNYASMQVGWHVNHVCMRACMTCNLVNSFGISVNHILDIHKYLMKKHDTK